MDHDHAQQEFLGRLWEHRRTGIAILLVFAALVAYWNLRVPAPGIATAALAVAANFMLFRGEMSGREKTAWALITFFLLYVEIRSINTDQAKARAEAQERSVASQRRFEEVLKANERDFRATESHFESLIRSGKALRHLTAENLLNATGGNSFCYFELGFPKPPGSELVGIVWTQGKYPLRHVWMSLVDVPKFRRDVGSLPRPPSLNQILTLDRRIVHLGDLPAGTGRTGHKNESERILTELHFSDQGDKIYNIQFGALNGNWNEAYRLRRINGKWCEAIRVTSAKTGAVLLEHVDPSYPRANGRVDWNH